MKVNASGRFCLKRTSSFAIVAMDVFFAWMAASHVAAQDSHYWTNQFGNQARLLGGAVVGSATDLSAVYYNPGALALMEKSEILLAGNVFEFSNVTAEDALLEGQDTSFWTGRLSPSLFAGEIGSDRQGQDRIAYSFLTRQNAKLRMDARAAVEGDDFALPNFEFVSAEQRLEMELNEYWTGGTWAHPFGSGSGIGVSMFFAYRTHRFSVGRDVQTIADDGRAAVSIQSRDFEYNHWRVLWKAGWATRLEHWRIGITLTTPSLGIGGSGDTGFKQTFVGQAVDKEGNPLSRIAADFQKVSSDYRSPLSIGGGASRRFGNTHLHLAAEWFNGASAFEILDTEPFRAQSSGEILTTDVIHELDSVLNIGVGLEHRFNEKFQGYGGFHSDFSGYSDGSSANDTVTRFDLYHLSGGAILKVGKSDLTIGGVVAFGQSEVAREFAPPSDPVSPQNVAARFLRLTFILGFNFVFE